MILDELRTDVGTTTPAHMAKVVGCDRVQVEKVGAELLVTATLAIIRHTHAFPVTSVAGEYDLTASELNGILAYFMDWVSGDSET